MITWIKFENFKVFQNAELPLGKMTLLIGPNGAGKTTALAAISYLAGAIRNAGGPFGAPDIPAMRSIGCAADAIVSIEARLAEGDPIMLQLSPASARPLTRQMHDRYAQFSTATVFNFKPEVIASPVPLNRTLQVEATGGNLGAVLTTLQDEYPERFEALNQDLRSWLPEFERVLLLTAQQNSRSFMLRTKIGAHKIQATQLSQGTLISVALLTLCHLPNPPVIVGLEDPDHGMHPRLLRVVFDAMERLSNPQASGDDRPPVQVVVTTHSPFMVDLFRDRPEDVVLVEKDGLYSTFRRLADTPELEEILRDAHLGDAWFSGALGGVPVEAWK